VALIRRRLVQRRKAMGYTQESIAEKVQVDRSTIVRWERAETDPLPPLRIRLANALDLTLDDLDEHLAHIVIAPSRPRTRKDATATVEPDTGGDTSVDRRTFTISTALASLGVMSPLRDWITSPDVPAKIGMDQIQLVSSTMEQIERTDAAIGGDLLCNIAITMHSRLTRWYRESSYDRQTGEALQDSLGSLEAWIGWLALDSERRADSRRYLQDALLRARSRDDPQLEVHALHLLSMLVRDSDPVDALRYAEAAQRTSAPWATPRLATLLHLRTAHASAAANDLAGFSRELAKAKTQFDHGQAEDDPLYLLFLSPLEMTTVEGVSLMALGRPDRAVPCLLAGLDGADPAYQRNIASTKVHLSQALLKQGDYAGSAETALEATPSVAALRSRRTRQRLGCVRSGLGAVSSRIPRARDFTDAYDSAMANRPSGTVSR
jgi:transcriptional regulator with XRE-family HTH domain